MATAISAAPPPWTCKCQAYLVPISSPKGTPSPPQRVYADLEAHSEQFSSPPRVGDFHGGLGFAQIIRYSSTPVGPYDELVITPGPFSSPAASGCAVKKQLRITGIWVDSEATLYNGRRNWNIPKHLARFEWVLSDPKDQGSRPLEVRIFAAKSSSASSKPSTGEETPFFEASFSDLYRTPSFPFSSNWLKYLGFPTGILQPPLPTGEPPELEVGSDHWMLSKPSIWSRHSKLVRIDIAGGSGSDGKGHDADGQRSGLKKGETEDSSHGRIWWPGMQQFKIGLYCPDAVLELGHPDVLAQV